MSTHFPWILSIRHSHAPYPIRLPSASRRHSTGDYPLHAHVVHARLSEAIAYPTTSTPGKPAPSNSERHTSLPFSFGPSPRPSPLTGKGCRRPSNCEGRTRPTDTLSHALKRPLFASSFAHGLSPTHAPNKNMRGSAQPHAPRCSHALDSCARVRVPFNPRSRVPHVAFPCTIATIDFQPHHVTRSCDLAGAKDLLWAC